jgi:hypothetical protein
MTYAGGLVAPEPRERGEADVDVTVESRSPSLYSSCREPGISAVVVASSPCAAYVARFTRKRNAARAAESATNPDGTMTLL